MMFKNPLFFDLFMLDILSGVLFALFSGSYPLTIPDEARYVEIGREMFLSSNYITPHLNGSIYIDKPILFFWIESLLIRFFGKNEWSVRLLPEFFGVLGCLVTYWAGTKLYNRRTGLLSACLLMTMGLYFAATHYCNMDLMVAVLIACSLWFFIVAVNKPDDPAYFRYLMFSYFFAGVAFLAKGLIGLVFPAMIVFFWMMFARQWQLFSRIHIFMGMCIVLLIIAPWIILIQNQTPFFLYYFLYVQHFFRYLSNVFDQGRPFYFLFLVTFAGIFPWVLFLFQSIHCFIQKIKYSPEKSSKEIFILIWPVFILLFFSFPHSKLVGYVLPVFPPIAMMIAHYLDLHWHSSIQMRSFKRVSFVWCVIAMAIVFLILHQIKIQALLSQKGVFYWYALCFIFFVSAVIGLFFSFKATAKKMVLLLFVTLFSVEVLITASFHMLTLSKAGLKPLALLIQKEIKSGDILVSFDNYYFDLPFYTSKMVYVVSPWHDVSFLLKDGYGRDLGEDRIYTKNLQPYLIDEKNLAAFWHQNHRVFVLVDSWNEKKLKMLVKSPVYKLAQIKVMELMSNIPNSNEDANIRRPV